MDHKVIKDESEMMYSVMNEHEAPKLQETSMNIGASKEDSWKIVILSTEQIPNDLVEVLAVEPNETK